ncbi:hypothetical protein Val02_39280 [Virgisporangium aliadipatigenens]|uniref:Uncharacterized protein n=1 Tax=Virgisporangium aliadipatigenens TaxID=741659 RepID=A0A8J3YMD1_9ACTN|nr:hypothetical protein [Virgisporangium aliadipatigenens]GIJ47042.1 hypothetical protein Val02_39280 [Virgisporangium aliadipatigenens]
MRGRLWQLIRPLTPEYRFGRPAALVKALEWLRTGAAVWVVYQSVRYTGIDFEGTLNRFVFAPAINAGFAIPAVVLAMAAVLAVARDRRAQGRALLLPAVTMVCVFLGVVALAATTLFIGWRMGHGYWSLWLIFLLLVGFPAVSVTGFLVVRHWFRAADGHPMLPALCALGYAATQVAVFVAYGPSQTLPSPWNVVVGLGSPLSLAAFAGVELWVLHRWHGVSPRELPPPVPRRVDVYRSTA